VFHTESIANIVDARNAVKITVDLPSMSASPDERDVFGAQQQSSVRRARE
jgi:hypothetical protein